MARWFGWVGVLRPRVLGRDHHAGFSIAERAMLARGPHCPACGTGRLREQPGDPTLRVCQSQDCAAVVSLAALADEAMATDTNRSEIVARHRRDAVRLIVTAQAGTLAASIWAIYSGSWATLWGGLGIALVLVSMAVVARYRAWQVEQVRMFEARPPFGEFLAFEAASVLDRS